jgi:hypothetical protein
MPRSAKVALIGTVGLLCGGAAYLMITRGPALLLDLGSALAACF